MKKDIFALLKKDHRLVSSIFAKIEKTTERGGKTREKLYAQLRTELTVHAEGEEAVIYPRLKENEKTQDIAYESVEEHAVVKHLFSQLDNESVDSKEWTARITVLKEVVEHHVEEEEKNMFKKMRSAFEAEALEQMAADFQAYKKSAKGKPADKQLAA